MLPAKELKKNPIPEGVTDKESYKIWLDKKEELEDSPDRFYKCKTVDYTFDFFCVIYFIYKQIEKLNIPDYEAEVIKEKARAFQSLKTKINKYKYDAFKQSGEGFRRSVLDSRKAELLGLFGRFNTLTEVHRIVTTQWGIDVALSAVDRFRLQNLEAIKAEQENYVKDYKGLRLVYKKSRLDEYSGLYEDRKIKYEETKNRDDYKLLLQTLESIRKEIEGDRLTVDGSVEVNVQQTINLHIQQDVLRNLNILQFIISRVAQRIGKNPMLLMSRLEKSFYSKFTGITLPDNNINTDEIYYPSRELYDFNKIKTENAEVIEDIPIPEVKEEIKETGNTLLNALLKRKRMLIESEKKVELNTGIGKKIEKKQRKDTNTRHKKRKK